MNIDKELDELMDDPLLQITNEEQELFSIPDDMKKVMSGKKSADYVAQYKPCENFEEYKSLFKQVHLELKAGIRSVVKVAKTTSLNAGRFYFIDGVMLYLESLGEVVKESKSGLLNGRTRCILENGTETDILLQTLRKNVVSNGYGITEPQEADNTVFMAPSEISKGDVETGYIYVLSSLSEHPEITNINNLYKIGFTTNSVEERIKDAVKDPTYLMASVKIEASYKVVNLNSHIFETLIHQVLAPAQMQITVRDDNSLEHHPKEWYQVPLPVINTVIEKIIDGTITQYSYNPSMQCLEKTIVKSKSNLNLSGFKVLTLIIKQVYFDEIMSGEKMIEYRQLKQTTMNKYTFVDGADGKRYLRRYDLIRFYVGYNGDRESAIVEVLDTTYDSETNVVEYHLGKVLEHIKPNK